MEGVTKKFKVTERTRRKATLSNLHVIVKERSRECVPTTAPIRRNIEIFKKAIVKNKRERYITNKLKIENPKSLKYLTKSLDIKEEEDQFVKVMTHNEVVTIVSDGGLKTEGGFGWVAVVDKELIAKYHGEVHGSNDQLSSYQTEATGMFLAIRLMSNISKEIRSEIKILGWLDNEALMKRITKM